MKIKAYFYDKNLVFLTGEAYTRSTTMSIADFEPLVHLELTPAHMTLEEFRADYCMPESPVVAPHKWEKASVAMTKILFYGRTTDSIIIQRGGVHDGGIVPWLATYNLEQNEPTFYDELLFYHTVDTGLDQHGAYSNVANMILAPKNDHSNIVRFRMGGHVLEWEQNGIATGVQDFGIPIQ